MRAWNRPHVTTSPPFGIPRLPKKGNNMPRGERGGTGEQQRPICPGLARPTWRNGVWGRGWVSSLGAVAGQFPQTHNRIASALAERESYGQMRNDVTPFWRSSGACVWQGSVR